MKRKYTIGILLSVLLVGMAVTYHGCAVRLYAPYDPITDSALTKLYVETITFLDAVERDVAEGRLDAGYEWRASWYSETFARIEVLQARAGNLEKNEETQSQLSLLEQSFRKLEKIHAEGFYVIEEMQAVKVAIDSHFRALLTLEGAKNR